MNPFSASSPRMLQLLVPPLYGASVGTAEPFFFRAISPPSFVEIFHASCWIFYRLPRYRETSSELCDELWFSRMPNHVEPLSPVRLWRDFYLESPSDRPPAQNPSLVASFFPLPLASP